MPRLLLFVSIFLLSVVLYADSRPVPAGVKSGGNHRWHKFGKLVGAQRGSTARGLRDVKRYLTRFGYLPTPTSENTTTIIHDDHFDAELEAAVSSYQSRLGLAVTGRLDSSTVALMISPRCGVPDSAADVKPDGSVSSHVTSRFAYFPGQPRWTESSFAGPITLTYAISAKDTIDYLSKEDIKITVKRAFQRWSEVIPVNFIEADDYETANVKLGFFGGDHGDGEPFDGVLGVLAHAFSPVSGRLHLDEAERWAVDFDNERSKAAVDLESVATHEIGHVLGLAHSSFKAAVMYPSLSPRTRKVDLTVDDVEGVQALYGSNPNFNVSSLLESDTSFASSLRRRDRILCRLFLRSCTTIFTALAIMCF